MKKVTPIIQDSYIANKRLSVNDVIFLLQAWWRGDAQFKDLRTKRHTLVKLLETEGFTLDEPARKGSTTLRYDAQSVDAYLSPNGNSVRLTFAAGMKEYGIHPDYLDELVMVLNQAGFRLIEVDGAKRLYMDRPYDWETPRGGAMLAGAKPKY